MHWAGVLGVDEMIKQVENDSLFKFSSYFKNVTDWKTNFQSRKMGR